LRWDERTSWCGYGGPGILVHAQVQYKKLSSELVETSISLNLTSQRALGDLGASLEEPYRRFCEDGKNDL